ncbi:Na+ driven multidrug efflux pump [Borrelia hermsii YBT]|nr:Na+ driven multidrug efflux pump [Borrelia hermsii YBT]
MIAYLGLAQVPGTFLVNRIIFLCLIVILVLSLVFILFRRFLREIYTY